LNTFDISSKTSLSFTNTRLFGFLEPANLHFLQIHAQFGGVISAFRKLGKSFLLYKYDLQLLNSG